MKRLLLCLLLVLVACHSVAAILPQKPELNLQIEADRMAAAVSILQKKARKSLVNTAQDRVFHRYFATNRATNRRILRFHFDLILETLRDQRQMQEVALVDADGDFIAQVKEEVVKQRDFQDGAPVFFFADALAGSPRQAYTSTIHRMPETNRWVVSYATPIVHEAEPVALLYYDQGLDNYQRMLDLLHRNDGVQRLAVSSDGRVIWDSANEPRSRETSNSSPVGDDLPLLRLMGLPLAEIVKHADLQVPITDSSGNSSMLVAYAVVKDWYLLSVVTAVNSTRHNRNSH